MKKDPIDDILREMSEFLQLAQENASKPIKKIPPDVVERLDFLENAVLQFKEKVESDAKKIGINVDAQNRNPFKIPQNLTEKQKETWLKAVKLRWDAEGIRFVLQKLADKIKAGDTVKVFQKSPKGKKRAVVKRRSKFRKMGGDKWKRM